MVGDATGGTGEDKKVRTLGVLVTLLRAALWLRARVRVCCVPGVVVRVGGSPCRNSSGRALCFVDLPLQGDSSNRGRLRLEMMRGEVITEDNIIRFEDVPLATPNGDVLIEKMNLEVRHHVVAGRGLARSGVRCVFVHMPRSAVRCPCVGSIGHECADLWSERLRQVQSVPYSGWPVAAVRWSADEACSEQAVLHPPEAVPHAG